MSTSSKSSIGLIGGSGLEELLTEGEEKVCDNITIFVSKGEPASGKNVVFLPRHGKAHDRLPHELDHSANLEVLNGEGARIVIASSAVGSMNENFRPGDLIILDQFIDFSKFHYTTISKSPRHIDMTEPFCPKLRKILLDAAKAVGVTIHNGGTYVSVSGPRYETRAEIKAFKALGGDVVGMTVAPEATIAREKGMCYAVVATVTNPAAGISREKLSHNEVIAVMEKSKKNVRRVFEEAIKRIPQEWDCDCCGVPSSD